MSGGLCPFTGKTCHDKAASRVALRQLRAQARSNREALRITAYVCPFYETHGRGAGRYHVGHTPYEQRESVKRNRRRFR